MTAILVFAASQLAFAGVIVEHGQEPSVAAERVLSIDFAEDDESPRFIRDGDSAGNASGFVVNTNVNGLSPLLVAQQNLIAPRLNIGAIRLWNARLARSPCLEDLLKPA